MSCRFCGAASNPRWFGGYLCGTIDGHQSGLCGSLVRYGERIVMVSEIDALKARIARLEEAGSWRSIDTAPHDRNWVLGYDANDGETGMIIFDQPHDADDDSEREWTDGMRTWTPTHWMPIPEPPEAKEAKP